MAIQVFYEQYSMHSSLDCIIFGVLRKDLAIHRAVLHACTQELTFFKACTEQTNRENVLAIFEFLVLVVSGTIFHFISDGVRMRIINLSIIKAVAVKDKVAACTRRYIPRSSA